MWSDARSSPLPPNRGGAPDPRREAGAWAPTWPPCARRGVAPWATSRTSRRCATGWGPAAATWSRCSRSSRRSISTPAEPSPYSPVSRLFWSELILDLGEGHRPVPPPDTLDVTRADAEVRAALARLPLPDRAALDTELLRYAQFRGAQARLGRNWRDWPEGPRAGRLAPQHVDPSGGALPPGGPDPGPPATRRAPAPPGPGRRARGPGSGGGCPPGRVRSVVPAASFAPGMSVGAPPDGGFPSGQDWGFSPVLPEASRRRGTGTCRRPSPTRRRWPGSSASITSWP